MNVVDSSGWLEYFGEGSNADAFAEIIESEDDLVVPAIVLFEVGRRVWQQRGEASATEAMAVLNRFTVVAVDAEIAESAVSMAMARKLALADSIIYATAVHLGATLSTQDKDFAGLPGVRYLPKP